MECNNYQTMPGFREEPDSRLSVIQNLPAKNFSLAVKLLAHWRAMLTPSADRFRSVAILLAAISLQLGSTNASALDFAFLGALGGSYSFAFGINDTGQVTGSGTLTGDLFDHAILWNGSTNATDIGTSGGTYSDGRSVNIRGQVVGMSYLAGDAAGGRPTLWNGTTATDLGTLGGKYGWAQGINDSGQVVGSTQISANGVFHATYWNGSIAVDLGSSLGGSSYAAGINNAGQVVGYGNAGTNFSHAILWNGFVATDLGKLDGMTGAGALGLNNGGDVVGSSSGNSNNTAVFRATLWRSGIATALGSLPGTANSAAYSINNAGQVVGFSSYDSGNVFAHATLWDAGNVIDLNDYLDASILSAGWNLEQAMSINKDGSIVGIANNRLTGQKYAFELSVSGALSPMVDTTPPSVPDIPEPDTYALMLIGLVVMGLGRLKS